MQTHGLSPGDRPPDLELPDTDGRHHRLFAPEGPSPQVVILHVQPLAVRACLARSADGRRTRLRRARFVCVNPNDSERYPADSYEAMQARGRAKEWPVPYLRDETQEAARAFGARTTPDVFVLEGEGHLRYRGAPDSDYGDPGQKLG